MSAHSLAKVVWLGLATICFGHDFQSYFEEIDVVVQQIQVNVRDRSGNHVKGLTKEDFEIRLDGQVQGIEGVEEISLEKYLESDNPEILLPQSAKRLYVFLFDLRYTTKRGVLAAQTASKRFILDEMLPTDLVSIFTYHPLKGVELVTNFTNEIEPLLEAIDTLGLASAQNRIEGNSGYYFSGVLDEFADARNRPSRISSDGNDGVAATDSTIFGLDHLIEISEFARKAEQRIYAREVKGFLNSFEKFADALRLIKGRKNMIWFSSGFDSTGLTGAGNEELSNNQALIERGEYYRVSPDQYGRTDLQHEASELIEHLQGSGTVIFALDTSLLDQGSNNNVGLQSLNMIARDSGGEVYYNQNDLEAPLSRIKDITNDYYLISFYPEVKKVRKGKASKLKVKVDRPGAKVTATKGLVLEPDFRKLTDLERQIHLSEYIGKDIIVRGVPIQVGLMEIPSNNNLVRLHADVEIRGDYFLSAEKLKKNASRDIEVHVLAISKDSVRIFDSSYFKFSIEPEKSKELLSKTGIKYFGNVFVKPGDYILKVIVRDLFDGRVGTDIREISVGNQQLFGPAVLAQDRWVMLRQPEESARRQKLGDLDFSYPFEILGRTFVPQVNKLISGDQSQSFFYLLNYRKSPSDKTAPSVAALVMEENGTVIKIPPSAMKANSELKSDAPFLTSVVVQVDFSQLNLPKGKSYKLFTQFGFDGRAPLRSSSDFFLE